MSVIRRPQQHITYCKNSDIRFRCPTINDYLEPKWSDQEKENYLNKMRDEAFKWLNNQLEAFELETFALDNDKRIIEADYCIYLIIRGSTKKIESGLLNRYLNDVKQSIENINKFKTSRKKLNSQVARFTKRRKNMKDYGNLS